MIDPIFDKILDPVKPKSQIKGFWFNRKTKEVSMDEEEHYNEVMGLPNDYSPEEQAYDLLHAHENELSNCCGARISVAGFCANCKEHAEPMELEMEGEEW